MKKVLTIAGSDCSGGAGIQADLKTMIMNGVYGMSAVTALTAQNTEGVKAVVEVDPFFLGQQIDMIFEDIRPDAVKIGMISSGVLIKKTVERLLFHNASNIVVDPVMVSTSGSVLMHNEGVSILKSELLPIAALVTPNIPESEVLAGISINNEDDMESAGRIIFERYGCAVLVKGGHSLSDANDMLYSDEGISWFRGIRINNPNTHGTGCTLSSAIASNLAKGYTLKKSIENAKKYLSGALSSMLDLGKGSGPLDHSYYLNKIRENNDFKYL